MFPTTNNDAAQAVWQDYLQSIQVFSDSELSDPQSFIAKQTQLWNQHIELSQNIYRKLLGEEPQAIIEPAPGDRRFDDREWARQLSI